MSKHVVQLAKSVGNFIKYWGFKNVHGEIWTLLYLSKEPLNSRQIQATLGISKALLSYTINDLLDYNLIVYYGDTEHGRASYIANEGLFDIIGSVLKKRELSLIEDSLIKIKAIEDNLNDTDDFIVDKDRLKKIKKLTTFAKKTLNAIVKLQDISFKSLNIFK